jgi:hypothetical protein
MYLAVIKVEAGWWQLLFTSTSEVAAKLPSPSAQMNCNDFDAP